MRKKFFIVTAALLMIGSYAADNFDMAGILSYASGIVRIGVSPELLVGVDKAPDDTDAEETEAASGIVNSSEDGWELLLVNGQHQMGLSVDITTADWNQQDASVVWDWMMRNSYKYGFIQRYPENKTDITGIINEPWHYRYVGREAAQEIYEQGICLEEYLESK